MTITNHTRRIEELAGDVIHSVDAREYPNAHCALDDIEKEVRLAHRHIDHLQNVTDFCARPAGGDHGPRRRQELISKGEVERPAGDNAS